MKEKILYIYLFLLIAAIAFSPRFPLGVISDGRKIDIRAEDILILGGAMVGLFFLWRKIKNKERIEQPPFFVPILCVILWGFFSISLNLFFGNLKLDKAVFYFGKEIEFFLLYFLVFYSIKDLKTNLFLQKIWLLFATLNVLWIFYVIFTNSKNYIYYGANTFAEPRGPFPSGGFFLMLFLLLFGLFIFYYNSLEFSKHPKIFLSILSYLPIVGIVASGSRASAVGFFSALFIFLVLQMLNGINFYKFLKILFFISLAIIVFYGSVFLLSIKKDIVSIERVIDVENMKLEYSFNKKDSRLIIMTKNFFEVVENKKNFFLGKGVYGEAHSQYARVILERGIIGFFLFLWLVGSILLTSWKKFQTAENNFIKGLSAISIVATIVMLVMAIPNDSFMVVKIAEVYWFIVGMSAAIYKKDKRDEYE